MDSLELPSTPTALKTWAWRGVAIATVIALVAGAVAVKQLRAAAAGPKSGIELVIVVERDPSGPEDHNGTRLLADTAQLLRERLRSRTIHNSVVPEADGRLLVRVPQVAERELAAIKAALIKPGLTEFRRVHPDHVNQSAPLDNVPAGYHALFLTYEQAGRKSHEVLWVKQTPELTSGMIAAAHTFADRYGNPQISVRFTAEGRATFAAVTRALSQERAQTGKPQRLAIVIDGSLYSAPVVQEEITGGNATITGTFTESEALELASMVNSPLQVPLRIVEERAFGP